MGEAYLAPYQTSMINLFSPKKLHHRSLIGSDMRLYKALSHSRSHSWGEQRKWENHLIFLFAPISPSFVLWVSDISRYNLFRREVRKNIKALVQGDKLFLQSSVRKLVLKIYTKSIKSSRNWSFSTSVNVKSTWKQSESLNIFPIDFVTEV